MLLCELWVHLAPPERDSPGAVGHFLSTRPPPTHLPGRWPRPCAVVGCSILVGQPSWDAKQPPPPPPALCGPALWLGAVYWSGNHPETWSNHYNYHHHHQLYAAWRCGWVRDIGRAATLRWSSGAVFQEDAQQLVSRSEPADKIRVFPDFVGLLSDSPDLVFDQSLLCYFPTAAQSILNVE